MKEMIARIEWLSRTRGGRSAPPAGPRYVAPARFLAAAAAWPDEAWSLVVDRIDLPRGPDEWRARVHFLMEDAPDHLLAEGAGFELYEGKRCVAHGHVHGPAEEVRTAGPGGSIASPATVRSPAR